MLGSRGRLLGCYVRSAVSGCRGSGTVNLLVGFNDPSHFSRLPFFEIRPSPPARRRSRGRNNKEERRPRHAKRNRGAKADPRAASGRVKMPPDGPGKREVSSTGTAALPDPHLRGRSPVNLGSNVGYYLAQPHQCGIHVKRCRPLKGLPKCGDADRSAQQLQRKVSRKDRS